MCPRVGAAPLADCGGRSLRPSPTLLRYARTRRAGPSHFKRTGRVEKNMDYQNERVVTTPIEGGRHVSVKGAIHTNTA